MTMRSSFVLALGAAAAASSIPALAMPAARVTAAPAIINVAGWAARAEGRRHTYPDYYGYYGGYAGRGYPAWGGYGYPAYGYGYGGGYQPEYAPTYDGYDAEDLY